MQRYTQAYQNSVSPEKVSLQASEINQAYQTQLSHLNLIQ